MLDKGRVLIVDDNEVEAELFERSLRAEGYEVCVAHEGDSALDHAQDLASQGRSLNVVLLDLGLPDSWAPSLPLIPHLREAHPFVEMVIITGAYETSRQAIMRKAFREYDVCDFLAKPPSDLDLRASVRRAHKQSAARQRVEESHAELVHRNQDQALEIRRLQARMRDLRARMHRTRLAQISSEDVSEHVLETGLRLLSAVDMDQLLKTAIDAIQTLVRTTSALVFLRKTFDDHLPMGAGPEEYLNCLAQVTHEQQRVRPEEAYEKAALRFADEVMGNGESMRLPARVPVVTNTPEPSVSASRAIHSVLCVPLVDASRRLLGVVVLFNRLNGRGEFSARGFADVDMRVTEYIAAFLACGLAREHEIGTDPLTRIPNRRNLMRRVREEINHTKKRHRSDDLATWVGLADIDYFGLYNKKCGHMTGDRVLRDVARVMRDALRDRDFIARFGGEEFCLVLSGVEDEQAARAIFDRVRNAVAQLPVPKHEQMPFGSITVSIGATRLRPEDTLERAIRRCDHALQPLKECEETRNSVRFEPSGETEIPEGGRAVNHG